MKYSALILTKFLILSLFCTMADAIGMQSTADVKTSIEKTIAHLEKAVAAFDKGRDKKEVIEQLMEAKQVQKTFSSANGQLSMIKSRATQKLVQSRNHFNDGNTKSGGEAMKEALAGFKELKEKYNAAH